MSKFIFYLDFVCLLLDDDQNYRSSNKLKSTEFFWEFEFVDTFWVGTIVKKSLAKGTDDYLLVFVLLFEYWLKKLSANCIELTFLSLLIFISSILILSLFYFLNYCTFLLFVTTFALFCYTIFYFVYTGLDWMLICFYFYIFYFFILVFYC